MLLSMMSYFSHLKIDDELGKVAVKSAKWALNRESRQWDKKSIADMAGKKIPIKSLLLPSKTRK